MTAEAALSTPPLASGPEGPDALRPLLATVLDALAAGTAERGGPLPAGGPDAVTARVAAALGDPLPDTGDPHALHALVRALAAGAADPADPLCAAHLHCPPLAVATAADLAASALNPSLDSWDQAPAASALEAAVTRALARTAGLADALVTTGGTESNQLALLLAREAHGSDLRLVCCAGAHHSLPRAAWLLGLPAPVVLPAPRGTLDPAALAETLTALTGPVLVAATAGTTDAGLIDPCPGSPTCAPPTAPGCTSTRPTAAACCSATGTATGSPGSTPPTPSPSTCTNSAGNRPPPACSPWPARTNWPPSTSAPTT